MESGGKADLLHFVRVDLSIRPQQLALNASIVRRYSLGVSYPFGGSLCRSIGLALLVRTFGILASGYGIRVSANSRAF
jgi:hypothetical protein